MIVVRIERIASAVAVRLVVVGIIVEHVEGATVVAIGILVVLVENVGCVGLWVCLLLTVGVSLENIAAVTSEASERFLVV